MLSAQLNVVLLLVNFFSILYIQELINCEKENKTANPGVEKEKAQSHLLNSLSYQGGRPVPLSFISELKSK